MNQLTILNENGQLVVSSRQISESFNKRHDNVISKIDFIMSNWVKDTDLKNKVSKYFLEDTYNDESGKSNKQYLLTRDGFSFVVMGFTGREADIWKTKYIEAFNAMEQSIKGVQSKLSKELQAIFSIDQRTVELDTRLIVLEGSMTIDYSQQEELRTIANRKVVEILGGKDAPAYKECSKKAFSELWKAFKRIMMVNSYRNTASKEYEQAKEVISLWEPNRDLELMILGANSQMKINL